VTGAEAKAIGESKQRAEGFIASDAPTSGAKYDRGKNPLELLPTRPLEAIARVLEFGAKKYAPNNWRAGIAYSRVYAAILRHVWAWWRGEDNDPETGLPHLAHAGCEILFVLEYVLSSNDLTTRLDDRAGNDAPAHNSAGV
jgi:hypothetical protein